MKFSSLGLLCWAISFQSFAQQREFVWYSSVAVTELDDSLKNEDAVQILNQLAFDYMMDFTTTITSIQKVQIVNKKGLEKYNTTYIHADLMPFLETFSARIIKPDGSSIELKSEDIIREGISDNRDNEYFNHAKFIMKGMEVGDEIESIFIARIPTIYVGSDVSVNSSLYCLSSKVSITNYLEMDLEISNNGSSMNFSQKTNKSGGREFVWEEKNLSPFKDEIYSIPTYESPYFTFAPRPSSIYQNTYANSFEWDDFGVQANKTYRYKKITKPVNKALAAKLDWWRTETNQKVRLLKFVNYVNHIPYAKLDKDEFYSLDEYVIDNKIDQNGRIELLLAFAELENYVNFLGFTRDKYDGVISPSLPNYFQVEEVFMLVKMDGEDIFIFPSSRNFNVYMNEISPLFEGNNAVIISPESGDFSFIEMPISSSEFNKRNTRSLVKLNFENQEIEVNRKDNISGAFSYYQRTLDEFETINVQLEELNFDTLNVIESELNLESTEHFYPGKSTLESTIKLKNCISPIEGDSIYALKLSNMLTNFLYSVTEEERTTNFYPLFIYKDVLSVFIQSDSKIKMMNAENLKRGIQNEFGLFSLNFLQVNENVIKIDCTIQVAKTKLDKVDYSQFREIHQLFESTKNASLIIKKYN